MAKLQRIALLVAGMIEGLEVREAKSKMQRKQNLTQMHRPNECEQQVFSKISFFYLQNAFVFTMGAELAEP